MMVVTRKLEVTPDTGNLQLRFGLHSGPVTAGVYVVKSRFQLLEILLIQRHAWSNGIRNLIQVLQVRRIHSSQLVKSIGSSRDELVEAKGKGKMQTYWVNPKKAVGSVVSSTNNEESDD
jgi:hypothetical protein